MMISNQVDQLLVSKEQLTVLGYNGNQWLEKWASYQKTCPLAPISSNFSMLDFSRTMFPKELLENLLLHFICVFVFVHVLWKLDKR